MRFSVRTLIAATTATAIILWIGVNAYRLTTQLDKHALDGYLVHDAATMVIRYLNEHENEWPSSWESLEPYKEDMSPHGMSFEQLTERVILDFDPDAPERLLAAIHSGWDPPTVIEAKHWPARIAGTSRAGDSLIADHFKTLAQHSASSANSAVNQ